MNWHLKAWILEGSNNNNKWIQIDNSSFNRESNVFLFQISSNGHDQQPFKYIKVNQTVKNWLNINHLLFTSIEISGKFKLV